MLDATFASLYPGEDHPQEWGVRLHGEYDEVRGMFGRTVRVRMKNGQHLQDACLGRVLRPWDGQSVVYAWDRRGHGWFRTEEELEGHRLAEAWCKAHVVHQMDGNVVIGTYVKYD